MKELQDTDIMPLGKHKAMKTPMQDVPAEYLHWLWTNGLKNDKNSPVHRYILKSMDALKQENRDLIW